MKATGSLLYAALLCGLLASCSTASKETEDVSAPTETQEGGDTIIRPHDGAGEDPLCFPSCEGLECGDDGCGGSCGECTENGECIEGLCVCQPDCEGLECGDDGCGGSCGDCPGCEGPDDGLCAEGVCMMVCCPECDGKECGDDGCGGSCGECATTEQCVQGECQCVPQCDGVECGDDGCGGVCGDCPEQHDCVEGACTCIPDCEDKECGDDGCGGNCGECPEALQVCVDNVCQQVPTLGLPCDSEADCVQGDQCLVGMCTHACTQDGEPIEGACLQVSTESLWGTEFACAAGLDLCLPGSTDGLELFCQTDDDCSDMGLEDALCAGVLPLDGGEAWGLCIPNSSLGQPGEACPEDGACATSLCLPANLVTGQPGSCSRHCSSDSDCPVGSLCSLFPVEENGEAAAYAPLCIPFSGSLLPCQSTADCKIGKETCSAIFSADGQTHTFRCVESTSPQGLWAGGLCSSAADCLSPYCIFEPWSANVDAYCSRSCQSDADCPAEMACREVHVQPFGQVWPESPYVLPMCLKVAHGSPCFVGAEGVCAFEWSSCEPIPGGVGWVGACDSGTCPPSCDGKACMEDDGCGDPCLEPCLQNGSACVTNGECLSGYCVEGTCCSSQCNGLCHSCTLPGTVGTCTPIPAGEDPDEECGACQRCDGLGSCTHVAAGPEPLGLCGPCMLCNADGGCVPAAPLTDPTNDCGTCKFCDGEGGCADVPYGADPKEDCDVEEKETCGQNGNCDGTGSCAFWASMTLCGENTCENGAFSIPPHCDGVGNCLVQPSEPCTPFACNPEAPECMTVCSLHSHCAEGYWCNQGQCETVPDCPAGQKLVCNATVPADTTDAPNNFASYDSCLPGVPYNAGEKLYMFQTGVHTRVTVTVQNPAFDVALALLSGACDSSDACVQLADSLPAGLPESFTFDALPDTQYYLVVDGVTPEDSGGYFLDTECCIFQCAAENACGDDGCGGSCGVCDATSLCVAGQCQECAPEEGGMEPNESCESAFPIVAGDWDGLLCPTGDEDWYAIELSEGDSVALLLDFAAETVDLDLALYGPDCQVPMAQSTLPDDTEMVQSLIFQSGTYFVRVNAPALDLGEYLLSVTVTEPECVVDEDCAANEVCGLFICTLPPAPCPSAGKLTCGAQFEGDSTGLESGLEDYLSCSSESLTGPETIYTMAVQEETVVTLTLSGLPEGGAVVVLEEYCASEWACVGFAKGTPGVAAQVAVTMQPQTTYYVLAEGVSETDAGAFLLNADCCVPQCAGLECGDNGCGGDCGPCPGPSDACVAGSCVCQPSCDGKMCGDDGCGGSCGDCAGDQEICQDNQCICVPECTGLECGDDGCGGSCGECAEEGTGCIDGLCQCLPQCDGKECGDDGCGGECGPCPGPQDLCVENVCECQPSCLGKVCGDDGCGGSCGECEDPQETCVNGFCVCQPQCAPMSCGDDGCGGSCGECGPGRTCQEAACACVDDPGEPNATCQQAKGLAPGNTDGLAICPAGEEDWYAFLLGAGQTLTVKILFNHAQADLDMFLYDQSACSSYLKSSTSSTNDEAITFVAPKDGTYTIRVLEFSQQAETDYALEATIQ